MRHILILIQKDYIGWLTEGLSLKIKEISKYKKENGKSNIIQTENPEISQNFGFFNFILLNIIF